MPIPKGDRRDPVEIEISALDSLHERGAFSLRLNTQNPELLPNNARKDHDAYKVRVYVAVAPGTKRVLRFYTLTLKSLVPEDVSETAQEKFSRVAAVPAVYLGIIGVTDECAGGGIGKQLIAHAILKSLEISEIAERLRSHWTL